LVIKISGGLPSCPSRIPITTRSGAIGYRGRAHQAPLCRSVDVHNGGRPPLSFLAPHRWTPIFLRTTRSGPTLTLLAPRTA
jgi:hypothetical protein